MKFFSLLLCAYVLYAIDVQAKGVPQDFPVTINVKAGKTFEIELPANRTTGYSWYIGSFDEQALQFVRSAYKTTRNKRGLVGRGGTRTFVFKAKESTQSNNAYLSFLYVSPSRTTIGQTKLYQVSINK